MALLEVEDLHTSFLTEDGVVRAVDGVSFSLDRGRLLGIVGESGSGKSVTCLTMVGLTSRRRTQVSGQAIFKDRDLLRMSSGELRQIRGRDIAMIFQDPMTTLNPVLSVGKQLMEAIQLHQDLSRSAVRTLAREMITAVGIPNPDRMLGRYPFELSGGMRQRVVIAMALCNNPDLLIADEPTTALDVTTQAQILDLVRRLRAQFNSAIILITHDLGVVAEISDEVVVMYAGHVVEQAPVDDLFDMPLHPYSWGLLGSLPRLAAGAAHLQTIPGTPPSLLQPPPGCPFHPRCAHVLPVCREVRPALEPVDAAGIHRAACHASLDLRSEEAERRFGNLGREVWR